MQREKKERKKCNDPLHVYSIENKLAVMAGSSAESLPKFKHTALTIRVPPLYLMKSFRRDMANFIAICAYKIESTKLNK